MVRVPAASTVKQIVGACREDPPAFCRSDLARGGGCWKVGKPYSFPDRPDQQLWLPGFPGVH